MVRRAQREDPDHLADSNLYPSKFSSDERCWREVKREYYIVSHLGTGTRGVCYLVVPRREYCERRAAGGRLDMGDLVQIAKLRRNDVDSGEFRREVHHLQSQVVVQLGQRNRSVRLLHYDHAKYDWVVMSYEGISMNKIGRQMVRPREHIAFPVELVWHLFEELTASLALMHEPPPNVERVVHQDLLASNISLKMEGSRVIPVIIDWGDAKSNSMPGPKRLPLSDWPVTNMRRADRMHMAAALHHMLHERMMNQYDFSCDCGPNTLAMLRHPDMERVREVIRAMQRTYLRDRRIPALTPLPLFSTTEVLAAIRNPAPEASEVWGDVNAAQFKKRYTFTPNLRNIFNRCGTDFRAVRGKVGKQYQRDRRAANEATRRQTRGTWAARGSVAADLAPGL